jgi:hypothetical protein
MGLGAVVTWFGSAKAAKRIQSSPPPSKEQVKAAGDIFRERGLLVM